MITILIVDDDINKISKIILSAMNATTYNVEIRQASNVQEALEMMKQYHFHLLITDLLMPLRKNERPLEIGGSYLLKEVYKTRNKVNIPLYTVGLTSYDYDAASFSNIWNVWHFAADDSQWELKLRDLIFHIGLINGKIVKEKMPTLFVEGPTDKTIIELATNLFFPDKKNLFVIETIKFGGGSSWVERQLVIWAKTLFKMPDESYLQAVGLFDHDSASHRSITDIDQQIPHDSAGRSTFTILKLDKKYAKHLIPCYKGGMMIPITLEEMYSPKCWSYATEQGWLKQRKLTEDLLQDPTKWDRTNQSLTDYTNSLALNEDEIVYVQKKFDDDQKLKMTNYILGLSQEEQISILSSFESLLTDIFKKLEIS